MVILELYRTNTVIPELYGKIQLDGKKIVTEGTSSVFQRFLECGFMPEDNTVLSPEEEGSYLDSLKKYLSDQGFIVRNTSATLV